MQSYFHEIQSLYTLNDDISSYKNFMFLEVNANTKWNKIMLIPKFVRWNRIGICFQNNITTNAEKNRRKKKMYFFFFFWKSQNNFIKGNLEENTRSVPLR